MASISPGLFESEFFGHNRGAFTGAEQDRKGYLEHTAGGTLFLDEIGTLPVELQGKLLRVLQDGEYLKVGTDHRQKSNVRFIAATNENLEKLMARNTFRKDLYYRIRGGWLHLPPLREKKADIPILINRFLKDYDGAKTPGTIHEDALEALMEYDYPGNIRELKSIIQSAVNLCRGKSLTLKCLPKNVIKKKPNADPPSLKHQSLLPLADIEKEHIIGVYRATNGNKSKSARILGIGLNTLRRKLQHYGIQ
jgi:transcriptional regulator with PAS, ATPase and Fis domain